MKSICTLASLVILASGSAFAESLPVADSGLVSVFPNQIAQLNIVNIGDPSQSCSFSLSFIDDNGVIVSKDTTVVGGTSDFLQIQNTTADPMLLRAHFDFSAQLIAGTNIKDPMIGCYKMLPTLEVMDTNSTQVLNTRFYGMPSPKKGEKIEKIKICHKPNTRAEKTLEVAIASLKGHLGHGDRVGECTQH